MRVLALTGLLLAACESDPTPVDATNPDTLGDATGALDASSVIAWDAVETISNDGQIVVERVSYRSGGLLVHARVCRPQAQSAPVATIVYNHGGFFGLDVDPEVARCQETARLGYVWMGSSYRGEDGSEGSVEICLGEVDDVLELVRRGRTQPYVDPTKIVMWGGSHGGCITTRAVQRGAPVIAAMDVFGPTDWATLHGFWKTQIANGQDVGTYEQLVSVLEGAAGGTPTAQPAAYAARSPKTFLSDLPASVPFLVVHGTADTIVPPVQSCDVATALGLASYHVTETGLEVTTAPTGCEGSGLAWQAGPRPDDWPGSRYLVVYDGLGHETASEAAQRMLTDLATFTMAKL